MSGAEEVDPGHAFVEFAYYAVVGFPFVESRVEFRDSTTDVGVCEGFAVLLHIAANHVSQRRGFGDVIE